VVSKEVARPDPEELLRQLHEEDAEQRRGRLKIFLGYAPRVGKSARMLDEGRRRATRGQDVVVGWIQAKGAERVKELIRCFEVIPPATVNRTEQLDVDAILRRNPELCIIDELAWDNPPGGPHAHRWQDVEQLVNAGISVLTALNLQHVAEQQNNVQRITGKRASLSVPQEFVQSADEIEIVDASLDSLSECGIVKSRLDAQQCSELRELALLLAAEVVDAQLLRYMKRHGIRQSWSAHERILVSITPKTDARRMIESAARAAARFHGEWTALYIEQPDLTREAQERVDEFLEYARKLGAEIQILKNETDAVSAIIRFARESRITQLFVGHLQWKTWKLWAQPPLERLISASDGMDVRIFPTQPA